MDILVSNLLMYLNLQSIFFVMQKKSCDDVSEKYKFKYDRCAWVLM